MSPKRPFYRPGGRIALLLTGIAIAVAGFAGASPAGAHAIRVHVTGIHVTEVHVTGAQRPGATAGAAATGAGDPGQAIRRSGMATVALAAYGTAAERPGPGRAAATRHGPGHHRARHRPGRHGSRHHSRPRGPRFYRTPWRIAWSLLPGFHWPHWQFHYLNLLWMRESGWNQYAFNPSSGAYGIPQAVPGSKMATEGADWRTSARTQILWGMGYIRSRYATPWRAWQHELLSGWY